MGWLRCFTNHSICRSLADHSCLRHSSFDPLSAIAHSRNTVSSHEPETPGLRELAASWRPEENPCQSGFFSASLFLLDACCVGAAVAASLVAVRHCLQFPRARFSKTPPEFRRDRGLPVCLTRRILPIQGRLLAVSTLLRPPKRVESKEPGWEISHRYVQPKPICLRDYSHGHFCVRTEPRDGRCSRHIAK